MKRLNLQGDILQMRCKTWDEVLSVLDTPMMQVSIICEKGEEGEDDCFVLSRPLAEWEKGAYSFLYKRKEKGSLNPDPEDDGPRVA